MKDSIIFGVLVLLIVIYFLCNDNDSYKPIHNDGNVAINYDSNNNDNESTDDQSKSKSVYSDNSSDNSDSNDNYSNDSNSTMVTIEKRSRGLNNNKLNETSKKYHESSYKAQNRDLETVDKSYYNVRDITKNYTDRYTAIEDSDENLASIDVGNNKGTEKDKYNLNSFLPQEEEKDWFETIETVDVKNSHLINIYKPIGVNTIGSCQKNATYDLRGTDKAICPKFVVSPWMQSSIEPDRSMKSLC